MSLTTVAIVGRPNVGKSTLFNRLVGRREALVDRIAGVTRDRHYGMVEWTGRAFRLIDTGGIFDDQTGTLTQAIYAQTEYAIVEAQVILFVLDAREGTTAADEEIALHLHKAGKTVLLVANKAEKGSITAESSLLYRVGFGDPWWISAEHGQGIGDLLDAVLAALPQSTAPQEAPAGIQVAIVGRPNVGKSSLVNAILQEKRLLVDATPGTTRDAIDSPVRVNKKLYTLVDTAGMRKPRRIDLGLEKIAVAAALRRIQLCEVAVLVLDALVGIHEQDVRIASYIERQGKACVVAVNKWDALDKTDKTYERFVQAVHEAVPFLAHVPILSISALTGQRVSKLFPLIDAVFAEANRRVPTHQLNDFLKAATQQHYPPSYRGKFIKLSFFSQSVVRPPTFLCFTNYPEGVTRAYQRYLENQLRQHCGFVGTPIRLHFRRK